jgi:hypothetical protein
MNINPALPRGSFVQYPQGTFENPEIDYFLQPNTRNEWAWEAGSRPAYNPVTNTNTGLSGNNTTDPGLNSLIALNDVLIDGPIGSSMFYNERGQGGADPFAQGMQVGAVIPIQRLDAALQGPPTSPLVPAAATRDINGQPLQYNPQAIGGLFAPPVDGLFRTASGALIPTQEYLNNVNTIGYPNVLSVAGYPFGMPTRQAAGAQQAQAIAPPAALPPTGLEQMLGMTGESGAGAASSPRLAQAEQTMRGSDTDFYSYMDTMNGKIASLQSTMPTTSSGTGDGFDTLMAGENAKLGAANQMVDSLLRDHPPTSGVNPSYSDVFNGGISRLSSSVNNLGQSNNASAVAYQQQNQALIAQVERQLEKNMAALQSGGTSNIEKQRLVNENTGLLAQLQGLQQSGKGVANATGVSGTTTFQNNMKINKNSPTLSKLAHMLNSGQAANGADSTCVATTLDNITKATGQLAGVYTSEDPINPRGAMVRISKEGGWKSIPIGEQKTANSPYGKATVNVMTPQQYKQAFTEGKIPVGSVLFSTKHDNGLFEGNQSSGRDMGLVTADGGVHNYQKMGLPYGEDTKQIVVMVPSDSIA